MKFIANIFAAACIAATFVGCAGDDESEISSEPQTAEISTHSERESADIIGFDFKGEPQISYCLPRYLSAPETRTIYEVFSGEELAYGHLIMRTQPQRRDGMYFFVMFDSEPDSIGLACRFVLEVDSSDFPRARKFVFDVPETSSVLREVKLAVTGADWPNPEAKVNAWRLTLLSPSGKKLAQTQSWLWSVKHGESKLAEQTQ